MRNVDVCSTARYISVVQPYYTVSGKKESEYYRHNFDKVRHIFVIFDMNHPDTSTY